MLFAIIENDPADGPAPIMTKRNLEEMGKNMIEVNEGFGFEACGNSGNDAAVSPARCVM
jgi:hypothetical protein